MDVRPLDVRPVPRRRGIIQGEDQPRVSLGERPDHLGQGTPCNAIGSLAGGRDGGVAGAELVAELRGADPTGDGPPASGEDGPEEQEGEPRGESAVEGRGEPREPLARGGERRR